MPLPALSRTNVFIGYLAAEIEKAGYVVAPAEPQTGEKRKNDGGRDSALDVDRRRRSGYVVGDGHEENQFLGDPTQNEEAVGNAGRESLLDEHQDDTSPLISGALQDIAGVIA